MKNPKDSFIRFLKDHHAFDEWKAAVGGEYQAASILDEIEDDPFSYEGLLDDGWYFEHREASPAVAWTELDSDWVGVCGAC